MLAELADVLARDKFSLTPEQVTRFLGVYARRSQMADLERRVNAVAADPDDNTVLGTAVNGRAAMVVTGDRHLLALKEFEGIAVVTVDVALKILSAERPK